MLNNRLYSFIVNKNSSSLSYISIDSFKKDTLTYNSTIISTNNLRSLFKESIIKTYSLLKEELLFNISSDIIKDITLEEFAKYEDI